ncbi:MAG: hypothetical protein WAL50_02220 [Kineosporiaceae bacterium]
MQVVLPLRRIQRTLWGLTGLLVLADGVASAGAALRVLPYTLTRFFDGDYKVNFPTGAKLLLLLVATVLLTACWTAARRAADRSATGWLLLGFCTAFALMDETVYLHQSLAELLRQHFDLGGPLAYAWTIVYIPMAALASVFLLRNLRTMHPRVRGLLMPGGVVYVTGAILMEPVKSQLMEQYGENSLPLKAAAAVSDSMQLIGLTLLVCSLLTAVSLLARAFTLQFDHPLEAVTLPGQAAAAASEGERGTGVR